MKKNITIKCVVLAALLYKNIIVVIESAAREKKTLKRRLHSRRQKAVAFLTVLKPVSAKGM